jgi:hypothetical protein
MCVAIVLRNYATISNDVYFASERDNKSQMSETSEMANVHAKKPVRFPHFE